VCERTFLNELDAFIRDDLERSQSLLRIIGQAHADAVVISDDDLVCLIADVLGTLREAVLRVASEIDAIREMLDSPSRPPITP
jgi:hypothetical protein